MSYTLIMPCAGRSRRFPDMRPKYMLTTPSGNMALQEAINSVPSDDINRIVIGIAKDHNEKYSVEEVLKRAIDRPFDLVVIDYETRGPAETVAVMLKEANVKGSFCVKDADCFFENADSLPDERSFIAVMDIRNAPDMTRVGAKSFAIINEQNMVSRIVEKSVSSNYVSCGLYGFSDSGKFLQAFQDVFEKHEKGEVFLSHILTKMSIEGEPIEPYMVDNLIDVGTASEWCRYTGKHAVYLVDIDGVIFKNQSKFFPPYWDDKPTLIDKNVQALLEKQKEGAQLIFVTSRPEQYREKTTKELEEIGFTIHSMVMDCQHGVRYLVNDYSKTSNPYPTAKAINIRRNEEELPEMLDK